MGSSFLFLINSFLVNIPTTVPLLTTVIWLTFSIKNKKCTLDIVDSSITMNGDFITVREGSKKSIGVLQKALSTFCYSGVSSLGDWQSGSNETLPSREKPSLIAFSRRKYWSSFSLVCKSMRGRALKNSLVNGKERLPVVLSKQILHQ